MKHIYKTYKKEIFKVNQIYLYMMPLVPDDDHEKCSILEIKKMTDDNRSQH